MQLILTLLAFSPALQPQAQDAPATVEAVTVSESVRPARPGDEGPLRYPEAFPADPASYRPAPLPHYQPPSSRPPMVVSFDPATGIERRRLLPLSPLAREGWVSGRALREEVDESAGRSFGSLSAIDSTAYPYTTDCRIFFTQSAGNFVCSGTLIDPKNVITAGHCVHEGNGGSWSTNVSVAPLWDGDSDAFGTAGTTRLSSFTPWTEDGSWDGDMGFVRLDRPVGLLTGWLGYGFSNSTSWWEDSYFWMAGYPGSGTGWAGAPDQLYGASGKWDDVDTYTVDADVDWAHWVGGMSGSGVYWRNNAGIRYVYANLSNGAGEPDCTTEIGCCRMTQGKFDWFDGSFKPGGYPGSVDYVPLDVNVNTPAAGVRAGARVSSLSYTVGNASLVNPPNATVDVDVYLSSNDNISEFDTLIQSHAFTNNFFEQSTVVVRPGAPTIPASADPGVRFVGVIIDEADGDTGNNDSDGWDAARITVLEPIDAIELTGPADAARGARITLNVRNAPASSPAWLYRSPNLFGSTINGHPFTVGAPRTTQASGTTSASGTWSATFNAPNSAGTYYYEVRVDRTLSGTVYTYDSYFLVLTVS